MKIHLIILGMALVLGKAWNVDISPWYRSLSEFISNQAVLLNISIVFLIMLLVFLAVFLNDSGMLTVIRVVNIALREVCLFMLNLIAFGSLYCALWLDRNIWPDFQPIIALPVIGVLASVLCVNIIDFNQPVKPGIVNSVLLTGASFFVVNLLLI